MNRIKLFAVAAIVAGAGCAATAKDRPQPTHNWTGFYAGVQAGYGFGNIDWFSVPFLADGGLGGVVIGYNQQVGNLLFGLEGDFSFSRIKGQNDLTISSGPTSVHYDVTSKLKWLSTVSGRLGFTNGPWLTYGKAGVAWAEFDHAYNISASGPPAETIALSGSDFRSGWLVGAGVEYALSGPWSVRAEYNYINFATDTFPLSGTDSLTGAVDSQGETKQNLHLVKLGLNYRFGAPVTTDTIAPVRYEATGFDWTGLYAGGQIGYAANRQNWRDYDPFGAFSATGMLAGGQIGANVQMGVVVFGVEAEFLGGHINGSNQISIAPPDTITTDTRTDWLAIASARFGFVTKERWLTYVKGGVAAARQQHHIRAESGPTYFDFSGKRTHTGIVIGAGIEYAFAPNWSVNAEYNYIDFGRENVLQEGDINAPPVTIHLITTTLVETKMQIGKIGINYHF